MSFARQNRPYIKDSASDEKASAGGEHRWHRFHQDANGKVGGAPKNVNGQKREDDADVDAFADQSAFGRAGLYHRGLDDTVWTKIRGTNSKYKVGARARRPRSEIRWCRRGRGLG